MLGWGLVTNASAGWLAWQGYLLGPLGLGGRDGAWAFANLGVLVALAVGFLGTCSPRPRRGRRAGARRQPMTRRPESAPRVTRPATWLVVIDMQGVFADPASPWARPGSPTAAARVRALVPASPGGVRTRFVAPAEPTGAWRAYYQRWPFARQPPDAPLWQLVGAFAAATDAGRADLLQVGAGAGAARAAAGPLVLAGVSTDCCVLSTAVAAADAGVGSGWSPTPAPGRRRQPRAALHVLALYAPLVTLTTVAALLSRR